MPHGVKYTQENTKTQQSPWSLNLHKETGVTKGPVLDIVLLHDEHMLRSA